MKIELTEAELTTILSALDVAGYEECRDCYPELAEKLRARRDEAKELVSKKFLYWNGGDL